MMFNKNNGVAKLGIVVVTLVVLLSQGASWAEQEDENYSGQYFYVKPSSEVAVRRGQGTEFKIVALIKDGSEVVLLEENDAYAHVRLANGKDGWMLKRFLSPDPPLAEVVASLRMEKEEVLARESNARQELEELSVALGQSETQLTAIQIERDRAVEAYEALQRDTADVVKIKKDLVQTKLNNEQVNADLVSLRQENDSLKNDKKMNWFLAGSGVFLAGLIIGRMPSPTRRRKSSLM